MLLGECRSSKDGAKDNDHYELSVVPFGPEFMFMSVFILMKGQSIHSVHSIAHGHGH